MQSQGHQHRQKLNQKAQVSLMRRKRNTSRSVTSFPKTTFFARTSVPIERSESGDDRHHATFAKHRTVIHGIRWLARAGARLPGRLKNTIGDLAEAARRSTKSHTIDRSFASCDAKVSWFCICIGQQQWYMWQPLMLAGFERMRRARDIECRVCSNAFWDFVDATLGFGSESESSVRP